MDWAIGGSRDRAGDGPWGRRGTTECVVHAGGQRGAGQHMDGTGTGQRSARDGERAGVDGRVACVGVRSGKRQGARAGFAQAAGIGRTRAEDRGNRQCVGGVGGVEGQRSGETDVARIDRVVGPTGRDGGAAAGDKECAVAREGVAGHRAVIKEGNARGHGLGVGGSRDRARDGPWGRRSAAERIVHAGGQHGAGRYRDGAGIGQRSARDGKRAGVNGRGAAERVLA